MVKAFVFCLASLVLLAYVISDHRTFRQGAPHGSARRTVVNIEQRLLLRLHTYLLIQQLASASHPLILSRFHGPKRE